MKFFGLQQNLSNFPHEFVHIVNSADMRTRNVCIWRSEEREFFENLPQEECKITKNICWHIQENIFDRFHEKTINRLFG